MEIVKNNSLTSFFILSYLITILCVFGILITRDLGGLQVIEDIFLIISVTGPTIAATILAMLEGGFEKVKLLYSGILKWKVHPFWYIAGFSLMIVPLIVAGVYILLGGESTGLTPGYTVFIFLLALLENLFMGPLSEEFGWRGYALPKLESRFSAFNSSIILGILWASWHIPFYLTEERMAFYIFLPIVITLSILFTWAFNNTGGSTFISVIFHFSFNFTGRFTTGAFGLMPVMLFNLTGSIFLIIWVVLIFVYFKPNTFSRKSETELPYDAPTTLEKPSRLFWLFILAFIILSFLLSFILPSIAII